MTVKKHLRAQEIARENRLPCIYLVDSGGANLPNQAEVFPDREHFGRIFFNQATMSAAGIAADRLRHGLVHGRRRLCAGDVGRDDHRAQAGHDLSRRPAAGQGGDRRGRQRRGAGRRRRAYPRIRASPTTMRWTTRMRWRSCAASSRTCTRQPAPGHGARRSRSPPLHDAGRARRHRAGRPAQPYDVREVIARLVDGSEFDEFKAALRHHARHRLRPDLTACRSASSPTTASCSRRSALKGAHFIELCCQRRIPLLFLQNITGFMVGREIRGRRHRQGRRQAGDGGRLRRRCRRSR